MSDTGGMTPDDVRRRVAALGAARTDVEDFHVNEDAMLLDVLRAIADGTCSDPKECARIALEPQDWEGCSRWYA